MLCGKKTTDERQECFDEGKTYSRVEKQRIKKIMDFFLGSAVDASNGDDISAVRKEYWMEMERRVMKIESPKMWELVLHCQLKLMKHETEIGYAISEKIPFTLLHLHLNDRCFGFIVFRLKVFAGWIPNDPLPPSPVHWPYPFREDHRYGDAFGEVQACSTTFFPLSLNVALLVVKLRVVDERRAEARRFREHFRETLFGQALEQVHSVIQSFCFDQVAERALEDSQFRIIRDVLDAIHLNDPFFLPCLLRSLSFDKTHQTQEPNQILDSNAFILLQNCRNFFLQLPFSIEIIANFLMGVSFTS